MYTRKTALETLDNLLNTASMESYGLASDVNFTLKSENFLKDLYAVNGVITMESQENISFRKHIPLDILKSNLTHPMMITMGDRSQSIELAKRNKISTLKTLNSLKRYI